MAINIPLVCTNTAGTITITKDTRQGFPGITVNASPLDSLRSKVVRFDGTSPVELFDQALQGRPGPLLTFVRQYCNCQSIIDMIDAE